MRTGLTLGKYAPFHKGHEYLIRTALSEVEHLIVVVYNASDTIAIPTEQRAHWIQQLFPQVEIMLAHDGSQQTGYTQAIIDTQNAYLQKLLKGRKIDYFYSSEPYGQFVSQALNCENRLVDIARSHVPISATQIRSGNFDKAFLSKIVWDDIKPRLYFLGAPSTGKTTLANYVAKHGINGKKVAFCREYGREYWFAHQQQHRLTMADLETIAKQQIAIETQASQGDESYVAIDTTTLTTLAYAYYYFDKASSVLLDLVADNLYNYNNLYLCDSDFAFEDSWDRSGIGSQTALQQINHELLTTYRLNYTVLTGTVEQRYHRLVADEKEFKLCGVY